ncbi:HAD-IIIA family hydrolase [Variovorax sp. J22P240]|uniref:HAD-IIIA family hydrolase n=1 Tax=Variovorax sp. J22P240 TaxID=3053514 RepID=UPI0025788B6E|nr:HAD-IIIA family hydrolase [Variovorax sp. J22P240]MDL9999602.1 HAD-IIIA family hydrolase [Variovorax sp. J22P240]
MTLVENFEELRARASNWLSIDALPLWLDRGYDEKFGLFHERLDFSGRPVEGVPRRLMVQCRQLYVLAHLSLRGMRDNRAQIDRTWQQVLRRYYSKELPHRWAFSIARDGTIHDPKCDAYTLAFLLFALAWLYRLKPDPGYLALADEVFDILEGPLAASNGGVIDAIPRPDAFLRQNPTMHLLEACLALYESTGRAQDLARASALHQIFSERMLWRTEAALPELHDDAWRAHDVAGNWYEPGHHFEWVWLLRRFSMLSGVNVDEDVKVLLSRAEREGVDAGNFAVERVGILDRTTVDSRRSWGTCEYLKACAAEAEAAPAEAGKWRDKAAKALAALQSGFLSLDPPGLWRDRIDAAGRKLSEDVPASSFYHFVLALMECERVFGRIVRPVPFATGRTALFLDRDGVINLDTGYPSKPEDITFVDGASDAIRFARSQGHSVVVVTNQSGIARGYASEAQVLALHRWMAARLDEEGAQVDAWYHCPYHDQAKIPAYGHGDHFDRKPNPGMLLRAANDLHIDLANSFLIGDNESDVLAASRAGVSGHLFKGGSLLQFARPILARS